MLEFSGILHFVINKWQYLILLLIDLGER